MAHAKNHDYHILNPSIWPFIGAVGGFVMLFGAVLWMKDSGPWMFLIGLAAVLYVMFAWWSDVIEESQEGDHTPVVQIGLRYGFIFFIMSDICRCIFSSLLSSDTSSPAPLAIRFLRLA